MRRAGIDCQPYLFLQLAAERGQRCFAALNATAGSRPHHRARRLRDGETAQQDAILLVQNDRAD
jgi:hypothetical protein